MSLHRIYAIILRYLFTFRRSYDRIGDMFYWPAMDIIVLGLTGSYIQQTGTNAPKILLIIITGVLLWIIVWRAQYEVSVGLLDDLWSNNLVNIFVSPLKFSEWITSMVILGIIKASISFAFALSVAFFLYKTNIFNLGFYLIPFVLLLFMTGWWVSFIVSGVIIRVGTRIQTLAWITIYILSPFSGVYYPLSILPKWAQAVSAFIPTSYVFEGARQVFAQGTLDWNKVIISFILNVIFLILAIIFLNYCFKKRLEQGLVNLY